MTPVIVGYKRDGAYRTPWVVTVDGEAKTRHRTIGRARAAARRIVAYYRRQGVPVKLQVRALKRMW